MLAFYVLLNVQKILYCKQEVICHLAESLEYYDLLKHFDFIYCRDIENTLDILIKQFDFLFTKNEYKKLFEEKNKRRIG